MEWGVGVVGGGRVGGGGGGGGGGDEVQCGVGGGWGGVGGVVVYWGRVMAGRVSLHGP